MDKESLKIGFIGVGFMGYGMALNLINKNFDLTIVAHKKRENIDKLIKKGAKETDSIIKLAKKCNIVILCVTNTPIVKEIIHKITPHLQKNSTIIDITTHQSSATKKIYNKLKKFEINYAEAPVMGGPVQAKEGILGAIVGCDKKNFSIVKDILLNFCKDVFYFGSVGMGTKAKLVSNFLSLGTTTFVIESFKVAEKFGIDIQKFCDVAKLGSGNSGALNRIADKAINNDYKGYIFTVNNTFKDLSYIHEMVKDIPNAEKLSSLTKSFYEEAKNKGYGDLFISELIKK